MHWSLYTHQFPSDTICCTGHSTDINAREIPYIALVTLQLSFRQELCSLTTLTLIRRWKSILRRALLSFFLTTKSGNVFFFFFFSFFFLFWSFPSSDTCFFRLCHVKHQVRVFIIFHNFHIKQDRSKPS